MQEYSLFSLVKNALSHHRKWPKAWRTPVPKPSYDVVIIGAGGHGLATAYYLGKVHGITNVAVIEKGWLGGGNTGRNTTVVRSNYLFPESAMFYDFSLKQYERMSEELNYNVMLNQITQTVLFHDRHSLHTAGRLINAMRLNGIDVEELTREDIKELMPILDMKRFPVLGGYHQPRSGMVRHDAVAWAYARAIDAMGMDIIQQCEVGDFEINKGRVTGVYTSKGLIKTGKVGICVAGHSTVLANKAGFELPIQSMSLQAMVSEPIKPCLHAGVLSPKTGMYISQSDKGEIIIGGGLDSYPSYAQRGNIGTVEALMAGAVEMFPLLSRVKLMRQWAGTVDVSYDSSPILGKTPVQNMYVNCGFGTGGFKAIPAGGFCLAHTIANDKPHVMNETFNLERFTTGRFIDEMGAAGIDH